MGKSVEVIAPTTAAVTDKRRVRVTSVPSTIIATGLAGAEAVTVYVSIDDGVTWDALNAAGAAVALTASDNTLAVYSPMLLGFTKSATVAASGVYQN